MIDPFESRESDLLPTSREFSICRAVASLASWRRYYEDSIARMAGKSNHIAVGIGGSGLVGETVAILEAEAFRTGNVRSIVVQEDRICPSGMKRGRFGGKEIGPG